MSIAKVEKPEGLFILEGISCLVFNKDFTQCALSKKDNKIYIYETKDIKKTDSWKLLYTLKAHVGFISCLDWNANTNEILSVSHDKTAFVWTFSSGKWESSNVVANAKLGYLTCKWNSRGDKFCAGTSNKNLYIGYYNGSSDWWMCMNIKGHKSSVCTCTIDPTSLFVISGSTDLRVYIHSCYIPAVDDSKLTDVTKGMTCDFGTMIYEFRANTWITSVDWNLSGAYGIAACQNATVAVIDWKEQNHNLINLEHSPANIILPNGEESFYLVCYDRNIHEYELKDGKWQKKRTITEDKKTAAGTTGPKAGTSVADRLKKFQTMGMQKKENLLVTAKSSSNTHKSLIISSVTKDKTMITTDVSGFIKYWNL